MGRVRDSDVDGREPRNFFSDGAFVGAINAAGANSANTNGFATGIEAGYNWQNGPFLLGVEADLQSLHLNGAASSGAIRYPGGGGQFVVTSYSPQIGCSQRGRAPGSSPATARCSLSPAVSRSRI